MAAMHPAVTVTNIRNFIPIILEMDNAQYTSWVELFKIHCRAFQVIDHILLPATGPSKPADTATEKEAATPITITWDRLDAIVLQWIYGTISNDLLHTILKPDSTAAQAWQALANIFQDNKNSRALYLENKFSNTKLSEFPNVTSYCQALKVLADQLANVDAPVPNQRLVLQLIAGLSDQFDGVAMLLQQTSPLPDFTVARSKLILEESRKSNQSPATALHTTTSSPAPTSNAGAPASHPPLSDNGHRGYPDPSFTPQYRPNGRGYDSNQRGRGRNGRGWGRGRSRGRGSYPFYGYHQHQAPWQQPRPIGYGPLPQWYAPPCPYPTTPAATPPSRAPGILGPAPPQAYASSDYSYTPTNIEQAMHTMTLNPDQQWYLDTGATNHMSNTAGKLSSYINNSISNHIVVGNGFHIPILGTGHTTLEPPYPPLKLNHILHAPHLIKNLLSVRKLTTDNLISIEFDPFGFLVKDYPTRTPILRCNSTGDLYPLSLSSTQVTTPSAFVALSQDLWHRRLGHPSSSLLRIYLRHQLTPRVKSAPMTGISLMTPTTFRSLAGALQYLTFTRPDISYAV